SAPADFQNCRGQQISARGSRGSVSRSKDQIGGRSNRARCFRVQFMTTFWNHARPAVDSKPVRHQSSAGQTTIRVKPMSSTAHFLREGETIFPEKLMPAAAAALEAAKKKGMRLATAETVTAGLVSACLTSVSGASQIFDRGYVLYHESAKATGLGVAE